MVLFHGNVAPGSIGNQAVQSGKKTEVLPVIEQKIGLSFKQFTRAVLLAQNDFATFLKASDGERAEILQALTGTGRFELISMAVYSRCQLETSELKALQDRLAGHAPLLPEARAELEAASGLAENEFRQVAQLQLARESHLKWFVDEAALSETVTRHENLLIAARTNRDAAEPRRLELAVSRRVSTQARGLRDVERHAEKAVLQSSHALANAQALHRQAELELGQHQRALVEAESLLLKAQTAADALKPQLLRARELDSALGPLGGALNLATASVQGAQAALESARNKHANCLKVLADTRAERERLVTERKGTACFAPFAPDLAVWLDRLDRATEGKQKLAGARAEMAARQTDEARCRALEAAERAKEAGLREAAGMCLRTFKEAEAGAQAHDLDLILADRQRLNTRRSSVLELEMQLQKFESLGQQVDALQVELARLKADDESQRQSFERIRDESLPSARQDAAAAAHAYSVAEQAVNGATLSLRHGLVPDEPCPVCGALEHPYREHAPTVEAVVLEALRQDRDGKEHVAKQLQIQLSVFEGGIAQRAEQIPGKAAQLADLLVRLEAIEVVWRQHPEATELIGLPTEARAAAVATRLLEIQAAGASLEEREKVCRAAAKHYEDCRNKTEVAAKQLVDFETLLARVGRELSEAAIRRENATTVFAEMSRMQTSQGESLASMFDGQPARFEQFESDPVGFRTRFENGVRKFLAQEARDLELSQSLREAEAALVPLGEALGAAEAVLVLRKGELAEAANQHEVIRKERAGYFDGRAADRVEEEANGRLLAAAQGRASFGEALAGAEIRFATATASLGEATANLQNTRQQMECASGELDDWLSRFAAEAGRELHRAGLDQILSLDEAWMNAERAFLDALEGAVKKEEGALDAHKQGLATHRAARPTEEDAPVVAEAVERLRTDRAEIEARRDLRRSEILADDKRTLDCAELRQQREERQLAAEPWLKLNELIGSADGAKLRSIVQRRTLDILLGYTNFQLGLLSARYHLERLPESLNLIVVDREMGDERRSVHSLSGGESFLVSLALALGLASLTSNRVQIESLFIDEGFGSLDPATLNTAMGALMHLEAQGRKVGVISHVSEMSDAIPVQIRVEKGRSGASRLIVPGATATEEVVENPNYANPGKPSGVTVEELAARILHILEREGKKVSTTALRREIGCEPAELVGARLFLEDRVVLDGKSLLLAEPRQ
jgi:exonuclease SbcC